MAGLYLSASINWMFTQEPQNLITVNLESIRNFLTWKGKPKVGKIVCLGLFKCNPLKLKDLLQSDGGELSVGDKKKWFSA